MFEPGQQVLVAALLIAFIVLLADTFLSVALLPAFLAHADMHFLVASLRGFWTVFMLYDRQN